MVTMRGYHCQRRNRWVTGAEQWAEWEADYQSAREAEEAAQAIEDEYLRYWQAEEWAQARERERQTTPRTTEAL